MDNYGNSGSTGNTPMFVTGSAQGMKVNVNAPNVAPYREIDTVMQGLGEEIEQLAKVVNELENRLSAVLTPSPSCAENQALPVAAYTCALASSIDARISYVKANRVRLEGMLGSLQL